MLDFTTVMWIVLAVAVVSAVFYAGYWLGREQEKDRAVNEAKRAEQRVRRAQR